MVIKVLRKDLQKFLQKHNLLKKWQKSKSLFETNIHYPSLEVELLEPHWKGIYSFRLDKKYRALFFITRSKAEVFKITNHYKK